MFGRLMPTEGKFLNCLTSTPNCASRRQRDARPDDQFRRPGKPRARDRKHREAGGQVTYATVDLLHKTFITPIDRDDIHS
jgi:hypothetical protein